MFWSECPSGPGGLTRKVDTVGVIFSYDGQLDPKIDAHFQAALLYTTAAGQRRVRPINVVACVSEGVAEAMKFVDQDAVVSLVAMEAAARMSEKLLKDGRAALTEKNRKKSVCYRRLRFALRIARDPCVCRIHSNEVDGIGEWSSKSNPVTVCPVGSSPL